MYLIVIFLIIHILVCITLFVLRAIGLLKCDNINIFIALFVPVFGLVMLLRKRHSDKHSEREGETIDVIRPHAEEEKKSIRVDEDDREIVPLSEALAVNDSTTRRDIMLDILYSVNKSIVVEDDELQDNVVPLEEALVVNNTDTRRKLIIDVLYTGAGDYVMQLNDAKENKDTEVVHYAATALAEIQKEFDLKFNAIMLRRTENPDDDEADNEYQILLENYIASGLLEGDALRTQLKNYSQLLEKKIKKRGIKGRWTLLNKKADTDIRLEDAKALDYDIERMVRRWPDHENVYMYKLQSAVLKKDIKQIRKTIDEIREKNVYLSAELRSMIEYWDT